MKTKKAIPSKKHYLLLLVAVGSMFVFGQGCFFGLGGNGGPLERASGDLRVSWAFDGASFCPDDVQDVVLEVRTPDGVKVFSDIITNCADGVRAIDALAEGDYMVQVKALDIDNAITWESPSRSIFVEGQATADVAVNLAPTE